MDDRRVWLTKALPRRQNRRVGRAKLERQRPGATRVRFEYDDRAHPWMTAPLTALRPPRAADDEIVRALLSRQRPHPPPTPSAHAAEGPDSSSARTSGPSPPFAFVGHGNGSQRRLTEELRP